MDLKNITTDDQLIEYAEEKGLNTEVVEIYLYVYKKIQELMGMIQSVQRLISELQNTL